jgi:hypothetical protein
MRHVKDLVTLQPKVETDRSLGHLFPQPPYAWGSVSLSPDMVGMWQIPISGTRAHPPAKPSFTEGLPHLNNGLNVVSGEQEAINRIHTILDEYYTGLREDEEKKVAQYIYYEGNKHGLDPFLLVAMIRVESSFHNFSKSDMGAKGLMQILPHVGKSIAEEADIRWDGENTLFNPRKNIRIGASYMKKLLGQFNDLHLALAAYNLGPGALRSHLRSGKRVSSLFAKRVLSYYEDLQKKTS